MLQYLYNVKEKFLAPFSLDDISGLISFWKFTNNDNSFKSLLGEPYTLQSMSGEMQVVNDQDAPFEGKCLSIERGKWLRIPRQECPNLDIHGPNNQLTLVAWIKRRSTFDNECEFIAGQWNETNQDRQYGLFLNIPIWGKLHTVTGHLSQTGKPSTGFRYCADGPVGDTVVPLNKWVTVAMTYDGSYGSVWYNGVLDYRNGLNPYLISGGLNDGGPNGSDFTVGAVDRFGEIGNFFDGFLGGLAIFSRALCPSEIYALSLSSKKENEKA